MSLDFKAIATKAAQALGLIQKGADGALVLIGQPAAAATVDVVIGSLTTIALAIPSVVDLADEVVGDLSGPAKLQLVKRDLEAKLVEVVNEIDPNLKVNFDHAWAAVIGPSVNFYVGIKRLGALLKKL